MVSKKDGGWRPVVNFRALNQFVFNPHLKMESIISLKDIIQEADFMGRLDLKDAYLKVPITKVCWRLLRFRWKEQNYEFQTLPFGLASAPRVLTKLLRPVAAAMRKRGRRLLIYLDDILIMAQEKATFRRDLTIVVGTLSDLGFVINLKKSVFEPTTEMSSWASK